MRLSLYNFLGYFIIFLGALFVNEQLGEGGIVLVGLLLFLILRPKNLLVME